MAAEEDLVSSLFNVPSIKGEISAVSARLTELKADLLAFQKSKVDLAGAFKVGDIVTGVNASNEAMGKFKASTDGATSALKGLKAEQIELRNEGIRLANAQKQAAIDAKAKQAADKLAAKEAQEAGSERLRQLKAEQDAEEKLRQIEADRLRNEQQYFDNGKNQSTGGSNRPAAPTGVGGSFTPSTTLEEQVLLLNRNKVAIAENAAQQKLLKVQLDAGQISQAKYDKEIVQATILANEYKITNKNLATSIANIQKEQSYEEGTFKKREAALGRLKQAYKELTPAQQAEPFAVRQLGIINRLDTQVKSFSKTLGESQKNVGNYGDSFGKLGTAANKAFGALRTVANILPGLGISGLLLLIAEPLIDLVKSFGLFADKVDRTKEVLDGAGSAFSKASASVAELKTNVQLAKDGFLDKDKVVKEYNETIGKTAGQVKTLDEVEQALAKNGDNYIKVTFLKAAANLALEGAAKKAFEAEQTRQKKEEEFSNNLGEAALASNNRFVTLTVDASKKQADQIATIRKNAREKEAAEREKEGKVFTDIATKLQKDAAKLAKDSGFSFFNDADGDAKKAEDARKKAESDAKKAQELAEKRRAADLKSLKDTLEDQKKAAAELFANDLLLNSQRIEARKIQSDKEIAISAAQYQLDIMSKTLTNAQKIKLDEDASNEVVKIQAREEADIEKIRNIANKKRIDAENETNKEYAKFQEEQAKAEKERIDNLTKVTKEANEARILEITNARDKELNALDQKRKDGEINEVKYNRRRLEINRETEEELLYAQLEFAQKNLYILKAGGLNVTKQEEEIAKIRLKIQKDYSKKSKEQLEAADNAADLNASLGKFKEYYDQVQSVVDSALDASFTSQKNKIQELIDLNEEKKNKEIEAIERSTLSEQDKAAKILQINARAAAEKERLEQRQRQLDQRRAEYEKASKIAQIVLNGALAVTAQLGLGNIVGAVIAGALAAAQLAIAIATPIPKFKHGTKNAPEGLAWVGDGGKREVVESGGVLSLTPDTPTLTYLKAGDKVHPDADAFMSDWSAMSNKKIALRTGGGANKQDDKLLKAVYGLTHAVKAKPVPTIQNNQNGIAVFWRDQTGRQKRWLNDNMQS